MTENDHLPEPVEPRLADAPTEEWHTLVGAAAPGTAFADAPIDDEEDEWAVSGPARGIRLALPIAALVAVLLVAGGFWGGAELEKSHASASVAGGGGSLASLAARFRGLRGGGAAGGAAGGATRGGGAGGFTFGGGTGSSAATTGTISVVDGNTLYVLSAAGTLVKVTLGPSTTITRNAQAASVDLRPGDTVVVQGAASKNGSNVTASSISATGPGVSAAGGGFAGGGGAGANAAGGANAGG